VAADPLLANAKLRRERPDAIVLDVEMPRMDGLTFLRHLMAVPAPIPVVICSSLAGPGTEVAVQALDEGAVDVIAKPRIGLKGFLEDSAHRLVDAVRGATGARVRPRGPATAAPAPHRPSRARPVLSATTEKVIAIGASTGGCEALRVVLEAMPPDAPGIAIVQHMPEAYTGAFARRLGQGCRIQVKEAEPGDRLAPGRALVARGNHHLAVRRCGAQYVVEFAEGPPVSRHRPSVDVLFRSVAEAAGVNAVGAILTGMGNDGAEGLLALHEAGAHTIAQDESSCVVFGMPKEAIALGAAAEVAPLPRIADAILRRLG
ncbi:MAG TPA: chemotaxis response regulator protein-glutamate methylesterase, partial [Anaeromyxobacteraceae bacterium]|nr:chemotaxis response regulator protein-glutamate methylesterase [Anaeromyxobacteraceae bacterium]